MNEARRRGDKEAEAHWMASFQAHAGFDAGVPARPRPVTTRQSAEVGRRQAAIEKTIGQLQAKLKRAEARMEAARLEAARAAAPSVTEFLKLPPAEQRALSPEQRAEVYAKAPAGLARKRVREVNQSIDNYQASK